MLGDLKYYFGFLVRMGVMVVDDKWYISLSLFYSGINKLVDLFCSYFFSFCIYRRNRYQLEQILEFLYGFFVLGGLRVFIFRKVSGSVRK